MKAKIGNSTLELVEGIITEQHVDAVVNAAHSGLRGGGGVDGAIHRAGGPTIMAECRQIGGCPTGSAVITTGGRLPARYVIHAVGPIWHDGTRGEPELLASAYRTSLQIAEQRQLRTLAFPSLSTGAYGYPLTDAAEVALHTIIDHIKGETTLERVIMVLFGRSSYQVYAETLEELVAHDPAIQRA
jgi:O-acetyl-ADP-ribose deacetylase (regulator of RNase III)